MFRSVRESVRERDTSLSLVAPEREWLVQLFEAMTPWDGLERAHLSTALEWVQSDAPIYRSRPPDVPPMHLVSYFVALDDDRRELLLVAHRKAGLWLPSGGHVEQDEDPLGDRCA